MKPVRSSLRVPIKNVAMGEVPKFQTFKPLLSLCKRVNAAANSHLVELQTVFSSETAPSVSFCNFRNAILQLGKDFSWSWADKNAAQGGGSEFGFALRGLAVGCAKLSIKLACGSHSRNLIILKNFV